MTDDEPERVLFLALPNDVYNSVVFQGKFIQRRLQREHVNLIIFDISKEEIISWIKN